MAEFDFVPYMQEVATTLLALQHTEDKPCFSKVSSLPGLEEYLNAIRKNTGFQLVVIDNKTGRLNDQSNSDNLFDRQVYTFFIFRYVQNNDFEYRKTTLQEAKKIYRSILSKMFNERMRYENGLEHLERSSINYDTIGPIGNSCHGLMVHFTIKDFPDFALDSEEWID